MNATLIALAEPNRLRIVELLRERPRPVGEIAKRLRLRQPQVSKHLRVLSDAGLVDVRPVAQQRIYELRSAPFDELDKWLDEPYSGRQLEDALKTLWDGCARRVKGAKAKGGE